MAALFLIEEGRPSMLPPRRISKMDDRLKAGHGEEIYREKH